MVVKRTQDGPYEFAKQDAQALPIGPLDRWPMECIDNWIANGAVSVYATASRVGTCFLHVLPAASSHSLHPTAPVLFVPHLP